MNIDDGAIFYKWEKTASPAELELFNKVEDYGKFFVDMLFGKGSCSDKATVCQDDERIALPDELTYFSYSSFTYHVCESGPNIGGSFNNKEQTLTVSPKNLKDPAVILHEMIHLHEFVINELPLFYHDTLLWCLYQDLRSKIIDLDEKITSHAHFLNERNLYNFGGLHDTLFLLKSFDLDLKMHFPLGTVFGYELAEWYQKPKVNK